MEYKGKLYGKVGENYFPLVATSDDFDEALLILQNSKCENPQFEGLKNNLLNRLNKKG